MTVVEIAKYKLKKNYTINDVKKATQKAYDNFISKQKGFISWEVLTGENNLSMDLVHWETMQDAKLAGDKFMKEESAMELMQLVDIKSIEMMHLTVEKKY